jgi:hypothetical protein
MHRRDEKCIAGFGRRTLREEANQNRHTWKHITKISAVEIGSEGVRSGSGQEWKCNIKIGAMGTGLI